MNLLGWYLLISMMFVFAAMVEFAFVLLIKQRQESRNTGDNVGSSGSNSDKIPNNIPSEASKVFINVIQEKNKIENLEETDELEMREPSFWSRKYASFNGLNLTTKIDLAGIVLFHVSYMIFNVMYGVRVWNLIHENV